LETIGNGAFANSGVTELVTPTSLRTIGKNAFLNCTALKKVILQDGLKEIQHDAFLNCSAIETLHIPQSVTDAYHNLLGEGAGLVNLQLFSNAIVDFCNYASLETVVIGGAVRETWGSGFKNCTSLSSVAINAPIQKIKHEAFANCKALSRIELPDSLGSIGSSAFEGSGLTEITIPDSVTEIGRSAFADCAQLRSVTVGSGLEELDSFVFQNCTNLESVDLKNVQTMGNKVFKGCTSLKKIILPKTLTHIGFSSFQDCTGLKEIVFEGSAPICKKMYETFANVTATAYYPKNNPTWTPEAMENLGGNITWVAYEHMHTNETKLVPPTCTQEGYTAHICTGCGYVEKENVKAALGHDFAAATCEMPKTCRREGCGYQEGELGEHVWINPGSKITECGVCGLVWCGYKILLDAKEVEGISSVWIDWVEYPLIKSGDAAYTYVESVTLPYVAAYTYNDPNPVDIHTQYPTGMKVWSLHLSEYTFSARHIKEFDNLLQYSGSSIRIVGKKGIRMITSLDRETRKALTGKGLNGYTLEEYGTALAWKKDLEGGKPLILGQPYTKSNYAYKKGVADPVYKTTAKQVQYTNVLVGFTDDQCIDDIAMRPYIILKAPSGEKITIYGGIVYRSIGYIAYQNRSAFAPESNAYNYVWGIIHHVYGKKYDADYKG